MQENVIVAIFNVPSEAYQAFSELKAHTQTVDSLIAQAVLVKKENGLLIPAESTDFTADSTEGAWTGGLIGAWLGMLAAPSAYCSAAPSARSSAVTRRGADRR